MGADEEGTLERLKALRRQLVDPKIAEHHGRIVKTTGDGILVEFQSVIDAVRCAAEMQRGMAERNAVLPNGKRIEFRIGINLGDIIIDEGDIFGEGVNIAARLETLAEPGGICLGASAHEQVRDKLYLAFEDLGEQQVKNITRPVRVYKVTTPIDPSVLTAPGPTLPELVRRGVRARRPVITAASLAAAIGLVTAAWWAWPRVSSTAMVDTAAAVRHHTSPSAADMKGTPVSAASLLSFVVLPFANLSNDPEQEYFADAITEDLTTNLSRIDGSFVIARNTAFAYKGKPVDVKQIGRDLGVR